jgi:hypothetical protein
MTEDRKKSVWPYLVGMMAIPVLYVVSFGPVEWMVQRQILDYRAVEWYVLPMHETEICGPEWISDLLFNYRTVVHTESERTHDRLMLDLRRAIREICPDWNKPK